ncbi:hypothetical protein SPONN_1541 [uncultured Candidatus Thioglobus sp.]|nr:hypothetical protein SPONN_1541 [uncultured Candidatus Thioglobus sp.]
MQITNNNFKDSAKIHCPIYNKSLHLTAKSAVSLRYTLFLVASEFGR